MATRTFRAVTAVVAACGIALAGFTSTASSTPRSSGATKITVWEWGSPGASIKALTTDFERSHPKVKVNLVVQPFNSYFTLLRTAVASHKGPDVVEIYASPYVFDYYQGFLALTKYITSSQRKDLLGWNLVSTGLSNSGTPYAVPWSGQGILFYYNKKYFRQAGLNPNDPPKTWAKFLSDCAALKAHGIIPITAGFKDGYYGEWLADLLSGQLLTAGAASSPTPNYQSSAMVTAWNDILKLVKDGYMTPNSAGIPLFPNVVNNFAAGKGAMFVGLAANNANWSQFKSTLGDNLGDFLEPALPGSRYPNGNWFDYDPGLAWSITKWSAHPTQDYQYISYLAQPSSQTKAFSIDGTLPNTTLSSPTSSYPAAKAILSWVRTAVSYPGLDDLMRSNPETTYDKVITEMVIGSLSVKAALAQVQTTEDSIPPIPPK